MVTLFRHFDSLSIVTMDLKYCHNYRGYPVLIAGQVSPYKRLRGGVWFVDFIPKTTTGKINRRELRKSIDITLASH